MMKIEFMVGFCLINLSIEHEYEIIQHIFKDYQKELRPVIHSSDPVDVYITPDLTWLLQVNEKDEALSFRQWLPMLWNDQFLRWDPAQFAGTERIYVPATKIWRPDITIQNANKVVYVLSPADTFVEVTYYGNITLEYLQDVTVRCGFDVAQYPYDHHTCTVSYGSWAFPVQLIRLHDLVPQFPLELVTQNSEWSIIEPLQFTERELYSYAYFSEDDDEGGNRTYEELHYNLTIDRHPKFFITTFLLPTYIITTVCLVGVFAPTNSQGIREEKQYITRIDTPPKIDVNNIEPQVVYSSIWSIWYMPIQSTVGLTTLLTMGVLLQIITDEMPKTKTGVPLLGMFILIEMIMCASATLLAMLLLFFHQRAVTRGWKVPKFMQMKIKKAKIMKKSTVKRKSVTPVELPKESIRRLSLIKANNYVPKKSKEEIIGELIAPVADWITKNEEKNRRLAEWEKIFDMIDVILIIFFAVLNAMYLYKYTAYDTI